MSERKKLFYFLSFLLVAGLLFFSLKSSSVNSGNGTDTEKKFVYIGNNKISVELADSEEKRRKGLSGRTSLKEGEGMLFSFKDNPGFPVFWMKDMLISLDIIWATKGVVVKIDSDVKPPPPGTPDTSLTPYRTDIPVEYVLEVPAGYAASRNIKINDTFVVK